MASRITIAAAELELTDNIQSRYSHNEPVSPSWIVRRVSVLVSISKKRTVWWSLWAKSSAVITVSRRICVRRSRSSGQVSASAWNKPSAPSSLPTLPTFCR